MGDIYISGNGRRNQDTQDIPITPRRVNVNDLGAQNRNAQQVPPQGQRRQPQQGQQYDPRREQRRPNPNNQPGQNPNGGQQNSAPSPKKPKKKSRAARNIFIVLLVLVLIGSCMFGVVYSTASKIDYKPETHQDNVYVDSSTLMHDSKVTNILLIGVDGSSSDTSLRSDTMLMVSIDRNNKKIKLTSFLRDTWAVIPSTKSYNKLNAACSYGGAQLVMDTIEYNYNVKIDHYMLVGFDMFETIIDSVGGIDVEVTEKEAQFMRATARATREIQSGKSVHMNGAQALVYCRIRKLDSDFMRTYRQRKVITALIKKAKTSNPMTLKKLADTVLPMVQTDMSPMELTKLVFGAPKYIGYDVKSERVPHESTWKSQTKRGQSVIVTDFDANIQFLKSYLYSVDPVEDEETT